MDVFDFMSFDRTWSFDHLAGAESEFAATRKRVIGRLTCILILSVSCLEIVVDLSLSRCTAKSFSWISNTWRHGSVTASLSRSHGKTGQSMALDKSDYQDLVYISL